MVSLPLSDPPSADGALQPVSVGKRREWGNEPTEYLFADEGSVARRDSKLAYDHWSYV